MTPSPAKWPSSIILVGCGNMGGALLKAWLANGFDPQQVCIIDPSPAPEAFSTLQWVPQAADLPPAFIVPDSLQAVVLAVKPQIMETAIQALCSVPGFKPDHKGRFFISLAAGTDLAALGAQLGSVPIIRTMPNTPAAIGSGASVLCKNTICPEDIFDLAQNLLRSVGEAFAIDDESLIDAVTALSGSGPAYVFALIEAMGKAGVELGLPQPLAERLALLTVAGAGKLAHQSTIAPATLRANVTSPGGTTAAALSVLLDGQSGLDALILSAMTKAKDRARELSSPAS